MRQGIYSSRATARSAPPPNRRQVGKRAPYQPLPLGMGRGARGDLSAGARTLRGGSSRRVNTQVCSDALKAQEPARHLGTAIRKEAGEMEERLEKRHSGDPGLPLVSDSGVRSDMSTRKSRYCCAWMRSPGKSLSTEANCSILFFTEARTCHKQHFLMSVLHSGTPASVTDTSVRCTPRRGNFRI